MPLLPQCSTPFTSLMDRGLMDRGLIFPSDSQNRPSMIAHDVCIKFGSYRDPCFTAMLCQLSFLGTQSS
jgi:hypothetical protein